MMVTGNGTCSICFLTVLIQNFIAIPKAKTDLQTLFLSEDIEVFATSDTKNRNVCFKPIPC